ncbi:MAG: acyl-CoA reductase, partial [Dehalococcoidia bacterium]|nr:acyl-CoA reductase [Dehalococcoidia bacterium]
MEQTCEQLGLLKNEGGVVRVPFLIKGRLVVPPEIPRDRIEAAFSYVAKDVLYCSLPDAQLIREPVIDRGSMRYTGEYVYQVLPQVRPVGLIETDIDGLAHGLYALPVEDILDYLGLLSAALADNQRLVSRVREICRLTSELPDALLDGWFDTFPVVFNREAARAMIDNELSLWGIQGSRLLNGWVEAPSMPVPGVVSSLAGGIRRDGTPPERAATLIRAMPTRQLHIAAGNAPEIPVICALRAILTKSAAVVKCPHGTTLGGALLSLAAAVAAPDHPITRSLSLVYWQGGDETIESALFLPNAFDRIIVWGSSETVASVQSRTPFTRVISFNPRYSVSLIGRESFGDDLEDVAARACMDSLIHNQKACTSSLVHYVEGSEEQANLYGETVQRALAKWDVLMPQFVAPAARGQIKRMKRGKYAGARWYLNG